MSPAKAWPTSWKVSHVSSVTHVAGLKCYLSTRFVPAVPLHRVLDRFAFQRGTVAGETPDEIMYSGGSSGLVYHISYLRRRERADTKLYVSTAVHYKNWRGRLYFAVVRPGHRQLSPFMVSVMIRQAVAVGNETRRRQPPGLMSTGPRPVGAAFET